MQMPINLGFCFALKGNAPCVETFAPNSAFLIMQPAVVVVSLCQSDIFQLPAGVLGPRNCQLYFIAFLNFALTRPESSGLKYIYICQHDPPVLPMHSDVCLGFFAVPPK